MIRKLILFLSLLLQGCQSTPPFQNTAEAVDVKRYMGKWFVIANRPTFLERGVFDATESYSLDEKSGVIDINYRYHRSLNGPEKTLPQTAQVYDKTSSAHWKISLWWLPISLDYLIIDIDPDYQWTAVGVPNQAYLWIMSRKPQMEEAELQSILKRVAAKGYDTKDLVRVPQQP